MIDVAIIPAGWVKKIAQQKFTDHWWKADDCMDN